MQYVKIILCVLILMMLGISLRGEAALATILFDISSPSIIFFLGNAVSLSAANVGNRSIVMVNASEVVPALIRPGAHMTHGTRCPPSNVDIFPSLNGKAEPP